MVKYLTALDQEALMRDLNRVARLALGSFHYATMLAVGWHSRKGLLVVTSAGHPPPMLYRAARKPTVVGADDLRDRIRPVSVRLPIRDRGARHCLSQLSSECELLSARDGPDPDRLIGAGISAGYYRMGGRHFGRHQW